MDVCYHAGIYLPEIDLWLDPTTRRERAVVSHAHSDHVRRHGRIIATPDTLRLIAHRYRRPVCGEAVPWGQRQEFTSFSLTLLPAGHVRGSAQVLIERRGQRLLYSGDLKLSPSHTAEPAEVPGADVLIVEATFGRPRYRFPPAEEVTRDIIAFCRAVLAAGGTPVLLAYALGKAQELMGRLADAGLPLAVHPAAAAVCQLYEAMGVPLPPYRLLGSDPAPGVVICPPHARRDPLLIGLRAPRLAFVSGWAVDPSLRYRMGVDAAFCLSDHADYDELLEYVRRVGARRIYTVYGFAADLAADLRVHGYDASPLNPPVQDRLL